MNPVHNISKVNKKANDQVGVGDSPDPTDPIDPIDPKNKFLKGGSMNEMLEIGAKEPEPKRMFGPLWIEGEVAIFYATSKVGKMAYLF